LNRVVEIAGPDAIGIDQAVRKFLAATGDTRQVVTDPTAPYYGIKVSQRSLLPDHAARLGPTHFDQWLAHFAHAGAATV
jgi:hypothetical protein